MLTGWGNHLLGVPTSRPVSDIPHYMEGDIQFGDDTRAYSTTWFCKTPSWSFTIAQVLSRSVNRGIQILGAPTDHCSTVHAHRCWQSGAYQAPSGTSGYQKLKTSINSNCITSCLALAEKIFHGRNPNTQLCCSSPKNMYLKNVVPFRRSLNRLSNSIRCIAPWCIVTTKNHLPSINFLKCFYLV